MKTRATKALRLNRETVRQLDTRDLKQAGGGQVTRTIVNCPASITACDCTGMETRDALCQ